MAHMIPPVPKEYDEKSEEGLVFKALKTLPEDYYVFHSVSVTSVDKGTIYEREIDFVVANPQRGILCIEAKNGGGIYYDPAYREWHYTNGGLMDHGGPYKQIASAKRTLREKVSNHRNPSIRRMVGRCKFMHAVWFFGMTVEDFDRMSMAGLPEEADSHITMLAEDMINPTKRIEEIFNLKLPSENYQDNPEMKLTDEEFQLLLESVLCPAFHLIPSPRAKDVVTLETMNQLLREQYQILEYIEDQESAVINGAAGTGKTMIAVEKARRHSRDGERVLFLCYNVLLRDHLYEVHKKSTNKAHRTEFEKVDFMTVSKLAKDMTGNYSDYSGLADKILECAEDAERFPYKHVIIDEGQDFGMIDLSRGITKEQATGNCSVIDALQEVVASVNGTFCLFYDKYQMIQGGSGREYILPACIEDSECRLSLKRNCRNTKEIAQTSVTPLRDKKNKAIKPTTLNTWNEPVRPVLHLLQAENEMVSTLNKVLDVYQEQEINDVVILTVGTLDYTCIAGAIASEDTYGNGYYLYPYKGKRYKVSTCIKFKGLEADAIILIDLDKNSFAGKKGMEFYVGTSRAKLRLDMICQLVPEEYREVIENLDPDAPIRKDAERMRKVLGSVFSADIALE